jgi:hypothetical protein
VMFDFDMLVLDFDGKEREEREEMIQCDYK